LFWLPAGGLVVIATASFAIAARLGDEADRREEAKAVLIRLEAKANTQRALQWQAIAAPDRFDQLREPEQVVRGQIAAILAELAALRPGDPSVHRVIAATRDWQAAVDEQLRRLAVGQVDADRRVDEHGPSFQRLSELLGRTTDNYAALAAAAERSADLGTIAVAALATMLTLVLLLQIDWAKARQRAAEARVRQERARLVHKVLTAAEQQRAGLAAELHDGPIQALTGLTLGLERSRLRLQRGRTDEGVELLVSVQGRLAAEIQSLRAIMATLRPPVLVERGLVSALGDYVRVVERQAGIRCTLTARLPQRLPPDQEVVLYRAAQEALTNVAKHARATSARVELSEQGMSVVLEVRDDGAGFDPDQELLGDLDHFGLAGMRQRVELAGGTCKVRSRPGAGTVVVATLPRELVPA
jgi:signal transduction histidine kinase